MRKLFISGLLALTFATPAIAQESTESSSIEVTVPGSTEMLETETMFATVKGIAPITRTVTLENENGEIIDIIANDQVRNFDQIQLGDKLVVKYLEAFSIKVAPKSDFRSDIEKEEITRAPKGAKPSGMIRKTVTILADVIVVNPKASFITVRGPRGNMIDVHIHDPRHFDAVKVGQQVEVVYIEAVAISMESAKPAM